MMRALLALLGIAALLSSAPAGAMMIYTPLQLTADPQHADVGGTVTFTVSADNASDQQAYAGHRVVARYSGESGGDTPTESNGTIAEVVLDGKANATFAWTVPEAVRDMNVFVSLMDGEENVASAHLRIGDAPPLMYAMGGTEGGPVSDNPPPAANGTGDTSGSPATHVPTDPPPAKSTPGPGFVLVVGGVAAIALLARRRTA